MHYRNRFIGTFYEPQLNIFNQTNLHNVWSRIAQMEAQRIAAKAATDAPRLMAESSFGSASVHWYWLYLLNSSVVAQLEFYVANDSVSQHGEDSQS